MSLLLKKNNKKQKGFTLVELLVVIALISLMASVGGGLFRGSVQKLKFDKAANDLLSMAQYARVIAIDKQQPYVLYIDLLENSIYLATTQANDDGVIEHAVVRDSFCKPVIFDENIYFEVIQIVAISSDESEDVEDLKRIVFNPDGTSQYAVVQIGNGNIHYTLTINAATGKAKIFPGMADEAEQTTFDLDLEV